MTQPPDAMTAEFDTVAGWTEEAVRELGPSYAVPAACRGSGSPSDLAWLAEALELRRGTRLLDAGAGVGGPAAWAAERFDVRPVLAEPMAGACAAARRLFGLPAVAAWSQRLPFRDGAFEAAWCLGVLCTTPEKLALLQELRRVLRPVGRLGLLVYVRQRDDLPCVPQGNSFPSVGELDGLLATAGFTVVQQLDSFGMGTAPLAWTARADRVDELVATRHGGSPAFAEAQEQGECMGRLLREGLVVGRLVHAVAG
ncbi:MAG: Methyltransferase type 11, S-adenosyl-L-methionine-dependent [Mycobacterium sp.]|nr:Methyltransferase type 11, S-adenosyl-L-methionine-dependent [Mycobacterium sp.]